MYSKRPEFSGERQSCYCSVYGCYNSSTDPELSFHGFPKDQKLQKVRKTCILIVVFPHLLSRMPWIDYIVTYFTFSLQVWTTRIKRDIHKNFRITTITKVCSAHFTETDFIHANSRSRRLKTGACPSVPPRRKEKQQQEIPVIMKSTKLEEDLKENCTQKNELSLK